jgi:hypothetical protein
VITINPSQLDVIENVMRVSRDNKKKKFPFLFILIGYAYKV